MVFSAIAFFGCDCRLLSNFTRFMARTTSDIQAEIIAAKDADANLSTLNSVSLTAIWRLWTYIVAVVQVIHEQLWDAFRVEIETKIQNGIWGTLPWFVDTAKKFQYGDAVEQLVDNQPYSVIDEAKKIIKLASVTESGNLLNVKVAKGTAESPTALSGPELTAFTTYIGKMKPAGVIVNTTSLDADEFRITADVYYDGQYVLADIETAVQSAIEAFLFAIPFDGVFYKNKFSDAVDNVVGVVNIDQDTAEIRAVQGATNTLIGTKYQTIAGYLRIDLGNYNLTFIAV